MAETENQSAAPITAGRPVRADANAAKVETTQNQPTTTTDAHPAGAPGPNIDPPKNAPKAEITNDQLKAYFSEQGIEFDGNIETLKKKLAPAPKDEPTEEQKLKEATKAEKRLLDLHLQRGGTTESFVNFKAMMNADPKALGEEKLLRDLVSDGFNEKTAKSIIKKMHLDVSEEEMESMDDAEKAEIQKERAFGLKKLEKRGLFIQQSAKAYMDDLTEEANQIDAMKKKTEEHLSKVEDAVKNFPRKQTFQLGEYEGQQIAPVEYDVPDDILTEVKSHLSPESIKNNFFTTDGSINIDFLLPLLVKSTAQEKALKHLFLTGQTRGIESIRAAFSPKAPELGGNKKPTPGNISSAGKPEVVRRPTT